MPKSIQYQLQTYKGYMEKLLKLIKKNPTKETLKRAFQDWQIEYSNLLAYGLEPRMDDEIYSQLTIY